MHARSEQNVTTRKVWEANQVEIQQSTAVIQLMAKWVALAEGNHKLLNLGDCRQAYKKG